MIEVTIAIGVIIVVFWSGYQIGYSLQQPNIPYESDLNIYCFECEITMPVKEKDGQFYCKNCGLIHSIMENTNHSITEDLSTTPCKHTTDGHCLRNENDYCPDGQCNCPHLISQIKVISSCVTCETTVEVCDACTKQLTEPKIDC